MTPQTETVDPAALLSQAISQAIVDVLGDDYADAPPLIRSSQNPEFGDFQSNAAMGLAKRVGCNPRELAVKIAEAAKLEAIAETPDIAGPGFINIRLKADALNAALTDMSDTDGDHSLGLQPDEDSHAIVIDLCGVNVAKQMHVGHLRSTIIGDSLARVLERFGRTVHRENHLGDWGLPIAMVLHQLRLKEVDLDTLTLTDLDVAYRDAQLSCRRDIRGLGRAMELHAGPHRLIELEEQNAGAHEALEGAKSALVQLQQGDADLLRDWKKLIDVTMHAVYEACDLLNVKLTEANNRGESFYRERLAPVVDAFVEQNIAVEDDGALVVRFEDREQPLLIRKSDGGFLYATTDLAAIRYRVQDLGADRVIYVVDARQRGHFRDVFDGARKIGWDKTTDGADAELMHIPFGSVLGEDGRPLKTRGGENVTLKSLLDEAIDRGTTEVRKRAEDPKAPTHELTDDQLDAIGRAVGIGAIKYADLSTDLVKDYVFSFERMISFEGNTGPYLQYAHARLCSILARSGVDEPTIQGYTIAIAEPEEKQLALKLLRYGDIVQSVATTLEPHRLCNYLYELANTFSTFYSHCSVLKADSKGQQQSRLHLCSLVRRVLFDGLDMLGIAAPEKM